MRERVCGDICMYVSYSDVYVEMYVCFISKAELSASHLDV